MLFTAATAACIRSSKAFSDMKLVSAYFSANPSASSVISSSSDSHSAILPSSLFLFYTGALLISAGFFHAVKALFSLYCRNTYAVPGIPVPGIPFPPTRPPIRRKNPNSAPISNVVFRVFIILTSSWLSVTPKNGVFSWSVLFRKSEWGFFKSVFKTGCQYA